MTPQNDLALVTDLYELTMAQAYFERGMSDPATFSLFVRRMPPNRGFLVAAGLEDVLNFLEGFRFSPQALEYLDGTGIFSPAFLEYLEGLRFTGEVRAMPEGTVFFPNEPVLEVTAPIIQAQVVETYIINQVNLQSLIATKAARCVVAARGRALVDFSLRRTQGVDAGLKVARSCYLVGFSATSNLQAGRRYGIPVSGTMAHSFVTAFEHEVEAFRAFAHSFPQRSILLIDTYDTLEGARKAVQVAQEMARRGQRLVGVRLDSGDLLALSREVRQILDEAGLREVTIVASGGLDEYEIDELLSAGAPIDAFGVGTKMGVSADAPWMDMAYKMVRYNERPVLKLSQGKVSLPGEKQVFRFYDAQGAFHHDAIALAGEELAGGEPLLERVMSGGKRLAPSPPLEEARHRFQEQFSRLPQRYKALRDAPPYPVELSPGLQALYQEVATEVKEEVLRELGES